MEALKQKRPSLATYLRALGQSTIRPFDRELPGYDGSTIRLISKSLPNGQTEERGYRSNAQDRMLQRITHRLGATRISEFLYSHDIARGRIATWSQQVAATPPFLHTFDYDAVNQLLSATITNAGTFINAFAYAYDVVGNRLGEQIGQSNFLATYNGLNEITATTAPGTWDTHRQHQRCPPSRSAGVGVSHSGQPRG